jgi:DNA-binding HxlR family transcriptional regulator
MDATVQDRGPNGPEKWGNAARAGWQSVPDALLLKQHELGLDPTDIVVLLNITSFWWYRDAPPFARTNIIAARMHVSPRTVQRSVRKLETKGYIRRADYDDGTGIRQSFYLDGLMDKLISLSKTDATLSIRYRRSTMTPEFSEEDEAIPF